MKILFNCLTMEKGGAERVIALLANKFIEDNDVSILTLKKSKDAYELNKKICRLRVDETSYKTDSSIKKIFRKLSFRRFFGLQKKILAESKSLVATPRQNAARLHLSTVCCGNSSGTKE